jgi:16S rRNA (guanine1207-N2)-methyltransferase
MNPPFHEGRQVQNALGAHFIRTAAQSLKPGCALYMVANSHLPYESVLKECFKNFEKTSEEGGFKVFKALR